MNVKVVSSDSDGNCYLLGNDKEILILECGVSYKKIKPAKAHLKQNK